MGHSGESSTTRMCLNSRERHIFLLKPQGKMFCPKTLLQHVRTCVQGQRETNIKEDFCCGQTTVCLKERCQFV